jgi:hypothetical protein
MQPHQFYIMHCSKPDSVLNAAGFSVRAASTINAALLRKAFELPAYELPMDLWAKKPARTEAPRRLARLAGGWIVHSSYLEKDTTNRDRSYFTHAIHDPSADLVNLPPPKPLSTGPFISDAALTMFLNHATAPEVPFDIQTQPTRLIVDRKLLLEHFLNAVLRAAEQPEGGRQRVYVHAEPGLVALLLYAAARLLPANIVRDLTFSTFEPAHRGLREFKLAAVVGTYLGHPGKWLEPEFTTVRGFGLDTFHPQYSSPELFMPIPGVAALVALAAAGQWKTIDSSKPMVGPNADGLSRIAGVLDLAGSFERLESNQPTADDLLRLARDPAGMAQMQAREESVWPHLQRYATQQPALFEAFTPWFQKPERILAFREEAAAAIQSHDLGKCIAHWNVLTRTQPPVTLAEHLLELLRWPKGMLEKLPTEFRSWLRRECQDHLTGLPKEMLPLLRSGDLAECETIIGDTRLPAAWRSTAILVLLRKSESREVPAELRQRAAIQLVQAAPDVLAAFCGSAFDNREKQPELLNELATAMSPVALFDRLLAAGEAMSPKRWRLLFEEFQPFAPNADPQWRMNGRRSQWLRIAGTGADAGVLWQQLAAPLDGRFLVGDYSQHAEWVELQQSLQTLGNHAPVPNDVRMKVWSYSIVRALIHNPLARRQFTEEDVHRAFWAFGVPPPPPLPEPLPPPPAPLDPFDIAAEEPYTEDKLIEAEESTPSERKPKVKTRKQDRSMIPILIGLALLVVTILVLLMLAWPKIKGLK